MVRRDRWYGNHGQSRLRASASERSSSTRKLASLILLLVLVFILINQTSNPKNVERVATAIGLIPKLAHQHSNNPTGNIDATEEHDPTTNINPETDSILIEQIAMQSGSVKVQLAQQVWAALLQKADPSVVNAISRKLMLQRSNATERILAIPNLEESASWYSESTVQLAKWSSSEPLSKNADAIADTSSSAPRKADIAASPLPEFIDWFRRNEGWITGTTSALVDLNDHHARALQLALDKQILSQVLDNAPWKSAERLPFLRTWQKVDALRDLIAAQRATTSSFPNVEVGQLIGESNNLRCKPLSISGTIFQCDDSGTITEPGISEHEYKILWLRTSETSNQPVCVYVPTNNVDGNVKLEKGFQVTVCGFFFKRHAYASQRGADVAPLILAGYVAPSPIPLTKPKDGQIDFRTGAKLAVWSPPVDYMTPFAFARESLLRSLDPLDAKSLSEDTAVAGAYARFLPILELERLAPEIRLLSNHQPKWSLSSNSAIVRVSAWVTRVQRIPIDFTTNPGFTNNYVYRCELCELEAWKDNGGKQTTTHIAFCASVPAAWLDSNGTPLGEIKQPCTLRGVSKSIDESPTPTYIWAREIEWTLDDAKEVLSVVPPLSESKQFLLTHGWNLSWFDLIRELATDPVKPISQPEYEPYFSLMQIAHSHRFREIGSRNSQGSEQRKISDILSTLLQRKESKLIPILEPVAMHMRVVRVTRIRVEDPTQATILGSDHYYQLDAMADIGNRSFEIKTSKEPVVYHSEYPVTCVSIEVPSWLLSSNKLEGKDELVNKDPGIEHVWYPRRKASATGWFYRFWSYKTPEISSSLGENKRQIGPLVVIDAIEMGTVGVVEPVAKPAWDVTRILSTMLGITGALGIWWYVRTKISKKPRARK